ncbi:MAG: Cof-type HAD-IIB family hydrolase [Caldilineaceae bacterium]
MISVIAVDLDETLLRNDGSVSPRSLAALADWENAGHRAVIATGRPPRSARRIPEPLLHLPCVCYNGAAIYQNGTQSYAQTIAAPDARWIVERLLAAGLSGWIGIEIDDVLYINQRSERWGHVYTPDLLTVAEQPAAKILLSMRDYLAAESTMKALPDSSKVLLSEKYDLAQIMPIQSSKATALHHLMSEWGISMDHVAAFGDDVNDVEMVAEAGLGVAMDNAVDEVKAVADRITASNDRDGVALVVEELLQR